MDMPEISNLRDSIFKHFELHANQRITLFRFYSAFIVLYLYGIGYIAIHLETKSYHEEAAGIIISVLFMLITYVFKNLDQRNHDIINNSRDAICYLETKYKYNFIPDKDLKIVQVFNRDKQQKNRGRHFMTHTKCFKLIFYVGYFLCALVIFLCLSRIGFFHYLCEFLNFSRKI